eukprot:3932250-Amphidinium_carterae.1
MEVQHLSLEALCSMRGRPLAMAAHAYQPSLSVKAAAPPQHLWQDPAHFQDSPLYSKELLFDSREGKEMKACGLSFRSIDAMKKWRGRQRLLAELST